MTFISSLIDFSDPQDSAAPRLRHAFGAPRSVLVAHELAQVGPLLDAVQAAAQQGWWCVGYLRYEAAPAFDSALAVHAPDGPLAWFAVYDEALPWPEDAAESASAAAATAQAPAVQAQWLESCPRPAFDAALAHIQRAIADGELYQVNFTAPLQGEWLGESPENAAFALFAALQRAQPGGYAAFIDTGCADAEGGEQLLSVSPELFFDWQDCPANQGGQILARPMKGTAARGATPELDAAQAAALRSSPKERAENVMIVDLLRNDISRVAQPFSVKVPRLFHTEALPTVWQMTSDVSAKTRPGTTLAGVFGALFPCGSVTGAPKVRAMQLIRTLEPQPRGVYCGAIGVVRPVPGRGESGQPGQLGEPGRGGIRATFNVPIRTVSVQGGRLRCGIGSGITSGAAPDAEWQEWKNKQQFLERASMPFDLLETLALENGQLRHAAEHLQRLAGAAAHFAYPLKLAEVESCLQALAQAHPQGAWRVRLLLGAQGQARAEAFALEASPVSVRLQLAGRPLLQAHDEFVRFKTTRRAHYDAFTPTQPGVFDTVLWNAEGEITECTRGNVAMLIDGRWVTPPLACGLLPGVGRALALREGRVSEAVVRVEDLPKVQGWAFLNSLRGWIAAQLA
jgi:para-aminobenzoate synthetase/4-amino-4-deoxychorismate lyase